MRVGDVRKFLPKDDDEHILIAWWEYGDGEAWPEWLTQEMWNELIDSVEGWHDWSHTHAYFCVLFEEARQ